MPTRLPAAIAVAALATCSFAADAKVEALLAKMRKAYSSTKTASLVSESFVVMQEGKITFRVETAYGAPNKVRAFMKNIPGEFRKLTFVTDGKQMLTTGLPTTDRKEPFSLDGVSRALFANLETLCFWDWKKQLSTTKDANMHTSKLKLASDTWNGKTWTVLEETAEAQKLFVRYFIDPKTSFIWRTVVTELGTKKVQMDCKVKSLKLNVPLKPSLFHVAAGTAI